MAFSCLDSIIPEIYSENDTASFFFSEIILIIKIIKHQKNKNIIATYKPNKDPD